MTALRGARAIRQRVEERAVQVQITSSAPRTDDWEGRKVGGWRKIWCGMRGELCAVRRASCDSGIWDLASDGLGAFQSMGSFPGHLIQGAWGLGNFTSYTGSTVPVGASSTPCTFQFPFSLPHTNHTPRPRRRQREIRNGLSSARWKQEQNHTRSGSLFFLCRVFSYVTCQRLGLSRGRDDEMGRKHPRLSQSKAKDDGK